MFFRHFQKIFIVFLGLIVAAEAGVLVMRYLGKWTGGASASTNSTKKAVVVVSSESRLDEVQSIQAALKEYKDNRQTYPLTLQDLVPRYLTGPSDPSLGFSAYRYVPIGDPIDSYTLSYSLTDVYAGLAKGVHTAAPAGLTGGEYALSGSDLDNDGVDDAVEIYVYRTDSQKADTDKDGFSDGVEIGSGHNPRGK